MPVTRRGVKRSSEVGDLRLSCKSYSWNFLGGGRDCEENYYYNYFFGGGRDCEENYYYNFFFRGGRDYEEK